MKYRFVITEYLKRDVVVEATTQREAREKLIKAYVSDGIVLDWSNYVGNDIDFIEESNGNEEADIN